MLFTQIEFALLLALAWLVVRFVGSASARQALLLAASLYFYAYWDWRFLGLLGFTTGTDYLIARALARTEARGPRRALVLLSLVANLGVLGFFKYFNFFIGSLRVALAPLGWDLRTLDIILPVGISFYTFQSLSYTLDVYRRQLAPCARYRDYLLYVSFFPQLVAGPIVRARDFLPQLAAMPRPTGADAFLGARQFIFGFFKKAFIADTLAQAVDVIFAHPGVFDGPSTWLGVLAYTAQIYCDFAGYSDMAIGAARALGFTFPENFNHPYLATDITDFWRRWHISLSTWLRDYLYIPLGGNRRGPVRTYLNLFITMLLGGLWHGANWTFVLWGGWHGLALAAHKAVGAVARPPARRAPLPIGWLVTLLIVVLGWVVFRADTLTSAGLVLRQMFAPAPGVRWLPPAIPFLLGLLALNHLAEWRRPGFSRTFDADRFLTPVLLTLMTLTALVFRPTGYAPFIYFQF